MRSTGVARPLGRARCVRWRMRTARPSRRPWGQVSATSRRRCVQHPEYVGGDRSEVTGLMRAVPGLLVKDGAESVYVGALSDGRAVAVKVADGGFRAGQVVLVAALRQLGAGEVPGADIAALDRWGTVAVLGHGEPVGAIRPLTTSFT